ncbi:MAG: ATP-binding cassette domain-containing protein [Clostridium sp.]
MKNDYAVEFENVYKIYNLKDSKAKKSDKFLALKNINFKVRKGEIVGILGSNGSGKSTLAAILAGISLQNEGVVKIDGEQALISIATGLNGQLTGYENIKAKGALLGLSKEEIEKITEGVIEFAELGEFLYQPIKKYSSGMKSRLGFTISVYLDPDIIIIDEALSVGDRAFAAKCIDKMMEFKERGKTIFFVSHSIAQIQSFCTKGLWIEGGCLIEYGEIEEVSKKYIDYTNEFKKKSSEEKSKLKKEIFENRIIKKEVEKKNLKSVKIIGIIGAIMMLIMGLILMSSSNINQEKDIVEAVVTEEKSIFDDTKEIFILLTGENGNEYINEFRDRIKKENKVIEKIVRVSLQKDRIYITNIPKELQYYYEKFQVSDELRFLKSYSVDLEKSNIITLEKEKYGNFLKELKIKNKVIDKKAQEILEKLNDNKNIEKMEKLLETASKEQQDLVKKYLLEIKRLDLEVKENKLEGIKNTEINEVFKVNKVENIEEIILLKKIVYIDEELLRKNIYYIGVEQQIEKNESQKIKINNKILEGETSGGETSGGGTSGGETSGGETSGGEAQEEENSGGGTPEEENPGGGTPEEENPGGGIPEEENPGGGTPEEEGSTEDEALGESNKNSKY